MISLLGRRRSYATSWTVYMILSRNMCSSLLVTPHTLAQGTIPPGAVRSSPARYARRCLQLLALKFKDSDRVYLWRTGWLIWFVLAYAQFGTERCCDIITAAAKIHNFLVDCREGTTEDNNFFRNLSCGDVRSMDTLVKAGSKRKRGAADDDDDTTFALVTDNDAPKPSGRKTNHELKRETAGTELRDTLCTRLMADSNPRPRARGVKFNDLGHVYFES